MYTHTHISYICVYIYIYTCLHTPSSAGHITRRAIHNITTFSEIHGSEIHNMVQQYMVQTYMLQKYIHGSKSHNMVQKYITWFLAKLMCFWRVLRTRNAV